MRYILGAVLAGTLAAGCSGAPVQRFGWVTGVRPEKIEYYRKLHANPWPGVSAMIRSCNIRNYSIYMAELEPGKYCLFSYLEYTGKDFDGDMKRMAADPETQRWWAETDPCQVAPVTKKDKGIWMDMERVFFQQ